MSNIKKSKSGIKNIGRCLEKLFENKEVMIFGIVICLLIIFKEPLVAFTSKYCVQPVLSKITRSIYNDVAFFLICLSIIIYFLLKQWKHYLPDKKIVSYSLLCSITYGLFRFQSHSKWDFTALASVWWLKYMDILIVTGFISLFWLVKLIVSHFRKNPLADSILFNDAPLESKEGMRPISDQDDYDYYTYAKNIANGINNSQFETAFAIGIISKWGGGKTSFFNMIKDSLSDDLIEIDFNPWRSANPKAIIKDFFETVRHALAPYSSQLEHQLLNYGEKIIDLNDSVLSKSAKLLFAGLAPDSALNELFDQINNALKLLDKKLVIFIDDIDRLDKEEVFEVIRLIRNTANFYNTFFVVAYDRAYLLHSLKCLEVHQYETFLEKIFQLEITLPYFDKSVLIKKFIEHLKKILPGGDEEQIENVITRSKDESRILFLDWVETMRDVTRLSNSVLTNIHGIRKEVDLVDFVNIEILRFKFPSVYDVLFRKKDLFLTMKDSNSNGGDNSYHLRYKDKKDTDEPDEFIFEQYLKRNAEKLSIPEYSILDIVYFVNDIFSNHHRISTNRRSSIRAKHLSITNYERLPIYFMYKLPYGTLSEADFQNALKQPLPVLKKTIKEWVQKEGKEEILQIRFQSITERSIANKEEFDKVVHSIFYMANLESGIFRNSFMTMRVKYDFHDLYNKISPESNFVKKYYRELSGKSEYNQFIHAIFSNPESSYYYEAEFLKEAWLLTQNHFKNDLAPIMGKEEVAHYLVTYLKNYCEKETTLTRSIWHFYNCCKIPSLVARGNAQEVHRDSRIPEANEIFINFITKKDLNTFLLYNIYFNNPDAPLFQVATNGNEVFGSPEKFKEFLYNQDETQWSYLNEYKQFYEEANAAGTKLIPFDFKVIDISKRIHR